MQVGKTYAELRLQNGRVLKGATITTYSPRTGAVVYRLDKSLATVQITQLDAAVAAELRAMAVGYVDVAPPKASPRAAEAKATAAAKARRDEAREDVQVRQKQEAIVNNRLHVVADAAARYASARFGTRLTPDANGGILLDPRVQMDDPVEIGQNRYKVGVTLAVPVEGKFGGGIGARPKAFEMEIEVTPAGRTKVVRMMATN